jgi:hypothetical protein
MFLCCIMNQYTEYTFKAFDHRFQGVLGSLKSKSEFIQVHVLAPASCKVAL